MQKSLRNGLNVRDLEGYSFFSPGRNGFMTKELLQLQMLLPLLLLCVGESTAVSSLFTNYITLHYTPYKAIFSLSLPLLQTHACMVVNGWVTHETWNDGIGVVVTSTAGARTKPVILLLHTPVSWLLCVMRRFRSPQISIHVVAVCTVKITTKTEGKVCSWKYSAFRYFKYINF